MTVSIAAMEVPGSKEVSGPSKKSRISVVLERGPDDVVGLNVDWRCKDRLRIMKMKEGLATKWNAANPSASMKAGDCIVSINGVSGNALALLEIVRTSSRLEMEILC